MNGCQAHIASRHAIVSNLLQMIQEAANRISIQNDFKSVGLWCKKVWRRKTMFKTKTITLDFKCENHLPTKFVSQAYYQATKGSYEGYR